MLNRLITIICQLLVGGTFVVSGLLKAIDPVGTSIKLTEYLHHFSMPWLTDLTMAMAWALALIELAIGLNVFFGRNRKVFVALALAVMAVFTPLTLYLAIANPVDDCGCFGDALVLTNWQTFGKNVVLLAATVWLVVRNQRVVLWLSPSQHTFYFYGVMLVGVILAGIGTWHLPYIDFRPYRPGVSLRSALDTGMDDGSPIAPASAQVEYVIVYAKDGEQQEFTLDNLPDEDSGWEFVETIERRTSEPSAQTQSSAVPHSRSAEGINLRLFDADYNDVTGEVLADTGYVFLLLSPDISQAGEHDIDCIEGLYEYSIAEGYGFYGVTLRNDADVERWRFRTGAEYPIVFADQQVIETMIRSNPGLMLLHDGVIQWKTYLSAIDVQALSSAKLSEQSYGQIQPIDRKERVFWIILWMVAPLLLYLPLNLIKSLINKSKNEKENCSR